MKIYMLRIIQEYVITGVYACVRACACLRARAPGCMCVCVCPVELIDVVPFIKFLCL